MSKNSIDGKLCHIFLYTNKIVLNTRIKSLSVAYKSVSNVGSHSGDIICINMWFSSTHKAILQKRE